MRIESTEQLVNVLKLFNEGWDIEHNSIKVYDFETEAMTLSEFSKVVCCERCYFCLPKYVNNFLFVDIYSGRKSALETALKISNYTKHKLKHQILSDGHVLLVFKKERRVNSWK